MNSKYTLLEVQKHFDEIIHHLLNGENEFVIITKNGYPIIKIETIKQIKNKRIGAAKKEMRNFDISLEDFNKIPTFNC